MRVDMLKKLVLVPLAIMLVLGLAGCGAGGAVAATVNGEKIMEDDVTAYIKQIRTAYGLEEDAEWADYLSSVGMTPSQIREDIINMMAQEKLIEAAAAKAGIEVSESDLDTAVASVKSQYGSDEEFAAAMEEQGMTEQALRNSYKQYYLAQQVQSQLVQAPEPTEEQIQAAIDSEAPEYSGAKRSSHILFSLDDQETAQKVLAQVSGSDEAAFAEAAKQYSSDGSAAKGGDVGWDKLSTFAEKYQTALDGLSVGQVTPELVQSQFGYHIIRCTDEFIYREGMTRADIPQEILDNILSSLSSTLQSQAYADYTKQMVESAEIVINDMPSGLPYDVSPSASDASAAGDAAAADGTTGK